MGKSNDNNLPFLTIKDNIKEHTTKKIGKDAVLKMSEHLEDKVGEIIKLAEKLAINDKRIVIKEQDIRLAVRNLKNE